MRTGGAEVAAAGPSDGASALGTSPRHLASMIEERRSASG